MRRRLQDLFLGIVLRLALWAGREYAKGLED